LCKPDLERKNDRKWDHVVQSDVEALIGLQCSYPFTFTPRPLYAFSFSHSHQLSLIISSLFLASPTMSYLPAVIFSLLPWPLNCVSLAKIEHLDESKQKYPNAGGQEQGLTTYLNYYAKPGVAPPSARMDPSLKLQERRPVRLWHMWKYGFVVATKGKLYVFLVLLFSHLELALATEVTVDIVLHNLWGPRRKSWGIEMTIINSLMRDAGRHSALVDVVCSGGSLLSAAFWFQMMQGTIRLLISLVGLVPLPSDALVTPVKFPVRRRNLRGILAEFDKLETGTRELSGEWVVGRKTWQRLQHEWKHSEDTPHSSRKGGRVVLYIHGGVQHVPVICIALMSWQAHTTSQVQPLNESFLFLFPNIRMREYLVFLILLFVMTHVFI